MKDILLTESFDLEVAGADPVCGESDAQTLALLLESVPGEWKTSPEDGIGLMRHAAAPERQMQRLKHSVQEGMRRNGIAWKQIDSEDGTLTIEIKQ